MAGIGTGESLQPEPRLGVDFPLSRVDCPFLSSSHPDWFAVDLRLRHLPPSLGRTVPLLRSEDSQPHSPHIRVSRCHQI